MVLGRGRLAGPVNRQWMGPGKATLFKGRAKGRQKSGDWPSFQVAVARARLRVAWGDGGMGEEGDCREGGGRSLGRAVAVAGPGVMG